MAFRKSFKLGGGFRINLSGSGIGVSGGVRGFRVGVGPRGVRSTVSVPGTGLSWTRTVGGSTRRTAPAMDAYRSAHAAYASAYQYDPDRAEYELFEHRLRALTSMHLEGWNPWDWRMIVSEPMPPAPAATHAREQHAWSQLQAFRAPLFGAEEKRRQLEQAVAQARAADHAEWSHAMAKHKEWFDYLSWLQGIGRGILAGQAEACQAAIDNLGPFSTFGDLGSSLNVQISRPWCVEAWLMANDEGSVVPSAQLTLTPTGKLSRKAMPVTRFWELYQDHVCSAALRIAREVFALLPIPMVLVHVGRPGVERSTGAATVATVLSVAFDRETFATLNLERIDPSDSMANFEHRMDHKKTKGMMSVAPLDADAIAS